MVTIADLAPSEPCRDSRLGCPLLILLNAISGSSQLALTHESDPAFADTTAESHNTVKDANHIRDNRKTKQLIEARDVLSKYRMFVGDCDLILEQDGSALCDPAAKRRKNAAHGANRGTDYMALPSFTKHSQKHTSLEPDIALNHAVIHSTVRETLPAKTVSPVPAVHATVVFRTRRRYQS
jgi:hypothetical protein